MSAFARMWCSGFCSSLLLSSSLFKSAIAAPSVSATFSNSIQHKFDTNGNAIDSTSGKIDYLGGEYVWYGLSNGCGEVFCGILSWSSSDLQTWHPNGFLFDANTTEIQTLCGGELTGNCGRPHIVYSEATNTYVLWVNANAPGYALFTSNSPTSGYTLSPNRALVRYQPPGPFMTGDFSVAVIGGAGYIVYSLLDFTTTGASIWPPFDQSIYLQPLTPSLTNTTGTVSHILSPSKDLVDYEAESPDIFKRGDYFYISASNTCGFCTGTLLIIYRSTSIAGPWTRQIISADTCGGQTTGVLTLPSPNNGSAVYLHQADLFSTAPITGTRTAAHAHNFQPLSFNADGSITDLNCSPNAKFTTPIIPGKTSYSGLNATDGSGELEAYKPTCNLPAHQLYQTWTSSKSGTLKKVGINIASAAPTSNLTLTLFRYPNNSALISPHFVWETLSTTSIPPSELSQAFEVVTISSNATVAKGDRLGLAVVSGGRSGSLTPLCVLMKEGQGMFEAGTVPGGERNLFGNGVGQVSFRGAKGDVSPVGVLGGEVKWFAVVE